MEPRTSQYVRSKLSNLMSNGETEAGLRQYWMPDDISVECYDCTSKFTSFRRRHHCRVCGQIFCSKCCSSYIPGKQIGYSGNLRVCSFCFCYFETYLEQGAATDTHQDGGENAPYMGRRQSLDIVVGSIPVPREYNSSLSLNSPLVSYRGGRKASSCANVYESVGGEGLGEAEKDRHETVKLKDPAALARLWQRVLDPDEGLTMETHRYYLRSYPGTFLGNELVDWLASQDRTTSRAQAVAIGQALLKASYITSLSGQSNFTDSTEIFQPGPSRTPDEEPDSSDTLETVQGPLWLQQLNDVQSSDSSRSLEVPDPTTIRVKKPSDVDRRTSSEKSATEHQKLQFDLVKGTIEEDDGVSVDGTNLDAVYKKHEAWYLDNLLEGAELGKDWAGVILSLADQAVKNVSPDARNGGDEMDIRWYVKVKSVPGGSAEESILIPGEVCSLQPAHRRMADRLQQPSIALVANSIVFQREETRFVSLETVWMQEEEYIKNMCGKLLSARPNIILVERTVARLAQDILLREGVTLVLNVKYRVLERLARLTQAKIISSVDSMLAPPKLGTCSSFFMKKFDNSPVSGSLMVFEGVPPELGGTIVLRGGSKQLLSKVKMVLKRLLLVKFNWKHEKSFVLNEYGCLKDSHIDLANAISGITYRLTISPFIKVEAREDPFQIAMAEDTKELPELLNSSCDKEARTNETFVQDFSAEQHPWCKSFLRSHIKETVEEEKVQDMLALFRASGWRRPESRTNVKILPSVSFCQPKPFPLEPSETLSVLFSSYSSQSSVAPNYCIPPWVVNMELYGNLDITLGGFLEDFCFSSEYQCPNKQCSTPITEHTRRFCHAGGGVEIHMQKLEAPIMGESNKLMMWKYCTSCQLITPIVPVTNDTWSLSFALFLQLLLHDDHLVRRGYNRPDAVCCHSLHQEHLTCFGKMDAVATFKYTKLQVWRVAAPPYNPEMPHPPCGQENLLTKLRTLKKHGGGVYSAVLELLLASKGDNAEGVATLMPEQEAEFLAYTERVKALEEEVMSRSEHETTTLDKLHLLARDIVLAYQVWNGKLEKMQEMAKKVQEKAKKNTSLHRSSSSEVLDTSVTVTVTKKPEPDTTVKKLISAILPPVEEALLPNPFPLDMHIITSVDAHKLDDPLPLFVTESQPSTIIAYLLSCGAYKDFLATDRVDDQGVKVKGVQGEREDTTPGSDLEGIHCELQFSDATTKFYCCSYFPHWFEQLRENIFPGKEEDLIYSLSGCSRWEAMGGKSGLSFFKTDDDRFILKQMSRFEFQSFLEFAPHYFEYITQCINSQVKTLLGKIIGVYKLGFKNSSTGAGLKMDVLIMENLFYNRDITKSYDLKGAIRNRLTVTEGKNDLGLVLLDENLVRVSCESPLYINSQDRQSLVEAIKRDAAFLASHNMMDYSLLAGISKSSGELVLGIIDYIRTFTWDKKLETLMKSVKSSGFLGGQAKTPTVIHPDLYKLRFTEAMSRYFLLVPDWSDEGACTDVRATWS